jgi:hypothetical protein
MRCIGLWWVVLVAACTESASSVKRSGGTVLTDTRNSKADTLDTMAAHDAALPKRDHSKWRPPMPMILVGDCPGESCTYDFAVAVCEDLRLRAADSLDARDVLSLKKGDTATLVTGNYHLIEPGLVLLRRDYVQSDIALIEQTEDGKTTMPRPDTLQFFAGDTVYILTYLELGSWKWWYRGQAGSGDEFWSGSLQRGWRYGEPERPAVTISEPRGEWWYKLRSRSGTEGWVRIKTDSAWAGGMLAPVDSEDWKCAR